MPATTQNVGEGSVLSTCPPPPPGKLLSGRAGAPGLGQMVPGATGSVLSGPTGTMGRVKLGGGQMPGGGSGSVLPMGGTPGGSELSGRLPPPTPKPGSTGPPGRLPKPGSTPSMSQPDTKGISLLLWLR